MVQSLGTFWAAGCNNYGESEMWPLQDRPPLPDMGCG